MARGCHQKTSARQLAITQRALQALEYRKQGKEYQEIARLCGYHSRQAAYMAVKSLLDRTIREPSDELRQLEVARLDSLQSAVWGKALEGDPWAIDRALKISQRRCELLGLNMPMKVAPTSPDGTASATLTVEPAYDDNFVLTVAQMLAQYGTLHLPPATNGHTASDTEGSLNS
jgi:hypothetical protein